MKEHGYIVLTYTFDKDGRRYTALCKELGTATFGRSLREAEERLNEAVMLHLDTLEEVGERDRFFSENGIKFHKSRPHSVSIRVSTDNQSFVQPSVQRIPVTSGA